MKNSPFDKNLLQKEIRLKILELAYKTNSGHIGSCLSCVDILTEVLFYQMEKKDKFILSKGHAALSLYVALYFKKSISKKQLNSYLQDGTVLGIHPSSSFPKDIPLATGSLGHGLSFACGLAKGFIMRYKNIKNMPRVFCLVSDGETNEGTIWEASQFASFHQLKNLIVLVDKNKIQAFGRQIEVLGDTTSKLHWQAFGFNVFEADGHNLKKLQNVFKKIYSMKNNKPNIIICQTVKGKGVSFMEDRLEWHYNKLDGETYKKAIEEIKKNINK